MSHITGSEAPSMAMSGRSWKFRSGYRRRDRRQSSLLKVARPARGNWATRRADIDTSAGNLPAAGAATYWTTLAAHIYVSRFSRDSGDRGRDRCFRLSIRQLMPAPQSDQSTDNGRDDVGALIGAIEVNSPAEESCHNTLNNPEKGCQGETTWVVRGRRYLSGDEARVFGP